MMKANVMTSKGSVRKYPNVMWFPRSKTYPQEIREVLKLAVIVQKNNAEDFFNDKLLGEHMAGIGSINVVGMQGKEYIKTYQGKSTGDVSYITNARMLIRVFRFLGLVTRLSKGKYVITELGKIFAQFNGDFPVRFDMESEEQMLLYSLANFAFYSVNDDASYRDPTFQIRPFIGLLNTLSIEPQCIYELIVTSFASKKEDLAEITRIKKILENLKEGSTTLENEFKKLGLDANDYSCVHNFYDSVKILVYLGSSLGLIGKTSNPGYGKKIAGKARHLKQASIFYTLTEKGKKYLDEQIQNRLIYYGELYELVGNNSALHCAFILAALNTSIGSRKIQYIHVKFFQNLMGNTWEKFIAKLKDEVGLEIDISSEWLSLNSLVSFNFFQSIPPEFMQKKPFKQWYDIFIDEFKKSDSNLMKTTISKPEELFTGNVISKFILDEEKEISYKIPDMSIENAQRYLKYPHRDSVFGGQDRFAGRISPTDSVLLVGDKVHVDNNRDALDLLIPLRNPDEKLKSFISNNIVQLVETFLARSDTWAKDQHYTWVRNCFRQLGTEAIYSGSGGMLSRADVSILDPFIGGIEAKSPTENRGSINTGAIRQALDARVQVGHKFPEKRNLPRVAIAVGRRITPLAVEEEKKWRAEGQSIFLISDAALYYLTLKTLDIPFKNNDIVSFFTENVGLLDIDTLRTALEKIIEKKGLGKDIKSKIINELTDLTELLGGSVEEVTED